MRVASDLKSVRIEGVKVLHGSLGIYVNNANATIVNSVIARASSDGIQVVGSTANAAIVHCTIENNGRLGFGIFLNATARIANTILRDNKGVSGVAVDTGGDTVAPNLTIKDSLVGKQQGCNPPTPCGWDYIGKNNNLSGNPDPLFGNPTNDDYRLQSGSPAIDKGDANDPVIPAADALGVPRGLSGSGAGAAIPDLGAFEYYSTANLSTVSVFPQIAIGGPQGGEYRTAIIGMNTSSVPVVARVATMGNSGDPMAVSVAGKMETAVPLILGAGSTARLEISSGAANAPLVSGYAKFQSSSELNGSTLFKVLDGGTIISEAGVGLSKQTRSFIVYIDDLDNAWSGYAIANSGPLAAHLLLTLRDLNGTVVGAPQSVSLPAGQHVAEFAWQRFFSDPNQMIGFVGSIEATSDQNVAAIALRYDNMDLPAEQQVFSTIPVLVANAAPSEAATTLYFPQTADGGGYRSNFILVNPAATPAHVVLDFFDDGGNPLALPFDHAARTSINGVVSAKGVLRLVTDGVAPAVKVGWVRVTSDQPIGGSAIFQTLAGTRITSEAGVASVRICKALHILCFEPGRYRVWNRYQQSRQHAGEHHPAIEGYRRQHRGGSTTAAGSERARGKLFLRPGPMVPQWF